MWDYGLCQFVGYHWSWVQGVMGDGSHGSWVTNDDPLSALQPVSRSICMGD